MLHEFAVEPTTIRNWDRLQFFLSNFGLDAGRLVARYPDNWHELVFRGLACGDFEKKKTFEALQRAISQGRLLFRRRHEYDDAQPWLDNAECEHAKRPFRAVVAAENPRNQPYVVEDDIDVSNPHELLRVAHDAIVSRKARHMAAAVRHLLQLARTVIFVDRNFSPKDRGFRDALSVFLNTMLDQHRRYRATRIEYHVGDRIARNDFSGFCRGFLPDIVPVGTRIRFVRWDYGSLHDRYILTDVGAFKFGQGLDEAGATDQQEVHILRLDFATSRQLLEKYIGPASPFRRDLPDILFPDS